MSMAQYFIVFHRLKVIPEIASVADQVPSYLLVVEVEVTQKLIVSLLHTLKLLLGGLGAFRKRKYAGDLCMVIEESTVELPVNIVFSLELFCVPEELHVADRVNVDLIELKLQTHAVVEIKYLIYSLSQQRRTITSILETKTLSDKT
jgi:hypothetical protein